MEGLERCARVRSTWQAGQNDTAWTWKRAASTLPLSVTRHCRRELQKRCCAQEEGAGAADGACARALAVTAKWPRTSVLSKSGTVSGPSTRITLPPLPPEKRSRRVAARAIKGRSHGQLVGRGPRRAAEVASGNCDRTRAAQSQRHPHQTKQSSSDSQHTRRDVGAH
eukprot:6187867-Pleurochrysis_carterae.AAC.3